MNMLQSIVKKIKIKYNISIEVEYKLIPTLNDKHEYVLHY